MNENTQKENKKVIETEVQRPIPGKKISCGDINH